VSAKNGMCEAMKT